MSKLTKSKVAEDRRALEKYLQEIANVPLISAEEEKELARRIKKGDQEALQKLTRANLRFVVSVAKQYQNQGLPLNDLISEGNLGLIEAAKRFDETKGFKFISYAVWWIRQAILQALAEQSRIVRLPLNKVGLFQKIVKTSSALHQALERIPEPDEIAKQLDMGGDEVTDVLAASKHHLSLDAPFKENEDYDLLNVLSDEEQPPPDEKLYDKLLQAELEKLLNTLTEREAEIIRLYYGINREGPLTLDEIGERFGLTRERIRQIKIKAIRRLRHASRSKHLKPYLK